MRYLIVAAVALVAIGCSDSGTTPSGKPYKLHLHYAAPGCGRILVTGGGYDPYVAMEPGQTITLGWDTPYTVTPMGTLKHGYNWQKSGDQSVRGSGVADLYPSITEVYDTVRCTP